MHFSVIFLIPLDVLAKNETVYEDMIDLLEEYKNHIPSEMIMLDELFLTVTAQKTEYMLPILWVVTVCL